MQSNIDNYIERLCRLVEHWSIDDEHHPPKLKDDIRSIGKALNRAGGVQLMRDAYRAAKSQNKCASVIAAYWDGIDDWRW